MTIKDVPELSEFVREVVPRYVGPRRKAFRVREAGDLYQLLRGVIRDEAREHFIAVYLDGANQVVNYSIVFIGSANSCTVSPREVFQLAVLCGAVSFIVAHNHPSGELSPSSADKQVTKRLFDGGELLGIKLLDHIIFSHSGYFSFQEHGLLLGLA